MAKRHSKKGKGTYAVYRASSRAEVNRKARIERHLKKHPNDAQTSAVKSKAGTPRTAPGNPGSVGQPEKRIKIYDGTGVAIPLPDFEPIARK